MTIDYTLTPDQLSNAIYTTILLFDEYSLKKKTDREGRQLIIDKSWNGRFRYFINETLDGSKLTLEALTNKTVSDADLAAHEERFLKNVFKIIDKEITITSKIASTNIYKTRRFGTDLKNTTWITIIVLIAVLFLIAFIFVHRVRS